ncbi:MAG: anhydro-N-acetylmuramic acid kinase, partial [Sphingobacteriales bacterium]|nr:anhydro-N-acetylmuramic acid kinase [Sphingobacteriales bacterium]
SLDGLDIAYVHLQESGGKWSYEIIAAECYPYSAEWKEKLSTAVHLSALRYQLLHNDYGHYIGKQINHFIETYQLHHKVDLVSSHGHTTFHVPLQKMTGQVGNGASIAAEVHLPVVSDLRAMDVAFGGEGAPIVPIGHKLLFNEFNCFLNIGGIANISVNSNGKYIAFDVCAANRVLNLLAEEMDLPHDDNCPIAAGGIIDQELLAKLNALDYYKLPYPKSLANSLGVDIIYPLIKEAKITTQNALCTYVEHIAEQINKALFDNGVNISNTKLFVTGGGALNTFLIDRLRAMLSEKGIEVVVPDEKMIQYKEALIMALIGALRWREEANVFASVTGAAENSIGGALWLGRL